MRVDFSSSSSSDSLVVDIENSELRWVDYKVLSMLHCKHSKLSQKTYSPCIQCFFFIVRVCILCYFQVGVNALCGIEVVYKIDISKKSEIQQAQNDIFILEVQLVKT